MQHAAISPSSRVGRFFRSRYPAASYETSERTVKDAGRNRIGRTREVKFSGFGPFKRATFLRLKSGAHPTARAGRNRCWNHFPADFALAPANKVRLATLSVAVMACFVR
jgi:hypothetical protein